MISIIIYICLPWRFSNDYKKLVNIVLVSLRAIALALDPLFFFVPVIHEDKKCISEDKKMWINAIFWRSVLDFIYLVQFVVKFSNTSNQKGKEGVSNNALIVRGTFECGHMFEFKCVQCTNALSTNSAPEDETSAEGQREEKKEDAWMRFMFVIMVILPIPQVRETSANL